MGNRKNSGAPTRKVKKHEKDKDNMESACKERSFPGRLENRSFKYSSLLSFSNCGIQVPSACVSMLQLSPHTSQGFTLIFARPPAILC